MARYEIATGIYKQENLVRVSTLLSVIGEEAVKAFDTFTWGEDHSEVQRFLLLLEGSSCWNACCLKYCLLISSKCCFRFCCKPKDLLILKLS